MKIPEPRKLKSGTWFIQLRLNGVSVPVTGRTKKECTDAAAVIKAEHRAGKREIKKTPAEEKTLKTLLEEYIKERTAVRSPSTIRGYTQIKDNRFKGYQDKLISSIPWQTMIDEELAICGAKTVTNSWSFVCSAMRRAELPVPVVNLPAVPVKEIAFLQPEEIKPFCAAVKGDEAEIGILLELQGLRRSEALGLDWKDVDLQKKTIYVHEAKVQSAKDGFIQKDTTKNRSSSRYVPIMIPQLYTAMLNVKDKTGPVVPQAADTLLRHIKTACKKAGVTVVGNHGLRHSFASLGYHLGLSERQLMDLGGWADYQTMHKIYIRIANSDRDAANNAIANFFSDTGRKAAKRKRNANQFANAS